MAGGPRGPSTAKRPHARRNGTCLARRRHGRCSGAKRGSGLGSSGRPSAPSWPMPTPWRRRRSKGARPRETGVAQLFFYAQPLSIDTAWAWTTGQFAAIATQATDSLLEAQARELVLRHQAVRRSPRYKAPTEHAVRCHERPLLRARWGVGRSPLSLGGRPAPTAPCVVGTSFPVHACRNAIGRSIPDEAAHRICGCRSMFLGLGHRSVEIAQTVSNATVGLAWVGITPTSAQVGVTSVDFGQMWPEVGHNSGDVEQNWVWLDLARTSTVLPRNGPSAQVMAMAAKCEYRDFATFSLSLSVLGRLGRGQPAGKVGGTPCLVAAFVAPTGIAQATVVSEACVVERQEVYSEMEGLASERARREGTVVRTRTSAMSTLGVSASSGN